MKRVYPYWGVYVDGQEQELLQANYLFRGVQARAGERRVMFRWSRFLARRAGYGLAAPGAARMR